MTFPPDDLCLELPTAGSVDDICFPGGFCLSYIMDGINKVPGLADVPLDFFSQIGPAMAPLQPLFKILDTVLAIFRCVQAIPDAITSLNPTELIKCIPALIELVDQLLKMIPQLSIPKMVIAILRALAGLLRGIASDFQYIQQQFERIIAGIDRATDLQDYTLNGLLVCAQNTLNDTVMSTAEALKGIGSIILLVNLFMGLFGGPEIPCFGTLIGDNVSEGLDYIIEILLLMAETLEELLGLIPDPDLVLTLALGDLRC